MVEEKKMFSSRVDPSLIKALKHLAVDFERPLADLIEEAISDYLLKHGVKDQES